VSVQPPADGKPHSPLQYFQQFITDDMMTSVAENTNLYSTQKTGRCVTTTKKELEQVVGIYFRMGLVQMPGNRVYWENDTYYKPVAEVMSRNRFQLLLRSVHFVDNFCISDDQKRTNCGRSVLGWTSCDRIVRLLFPKNTTLSMR